jgi:predicted O-methyltransferase YrrM
MEYAACGIPCIASPTESYRDYWLKGKEGEIGLLARWQKDWVDHLELLVNDDDLRRRMGRAARAEAERHTIQEHYVQWERLYQRLLGEHPQSDEQLARLCVARGALQKIKEFAPLLTLARDMQPRVVVEIGSAKGGTLYGWCQLAHPEALIVSIDLPGGEFGGGMDQEQAQRVSRYAQPNQTLHFLPRDSHAPETVEALKEILAGRPIDLLMIDGDHTYEGVRSDFEMYGPLVGSGGLVAFHDVLPHPGFPSCQVDRFWDELKHEHRVIEFLEPDNHREWGQWGGIGVVRVREALPVAA